MTEETKKTESAGEKIIGIGRKILNIKSTKKGVQDQTQQPIDSPSFRWFTLISIPEEISKKTVTTFNDEVANWVGQRVPKRRGISFLELYLTRKGMSLLEREIRLDTNYASLVDEVAQRISGSEGGSGSDQALGVAFNPMGLLITPALEYVFDKAFIVRHVEPPGVYAPLDESQIPTTVNQYLVGVLKVEDARGRQLAETPIRALVSGQNEHEGILHLSTHADFDLLFKAFPDAEFCSYPLGVNIECRLKVDGMRRAVSQVDLDVHDTKMLAALSQRNENAKLSYYLLEGGYKERTIDHKTSDIYHVDLKSDSVLKVKSELDDPNTKYEIAPGLPVALAGKVGMQVVLKFTNRDGLEDTDSYKFLFRFFNYALRFSTKTNKLAASGQFVPGTGETIVMLPPMYQDGRTEVQSPAFIIQPTEGGAFNIRRHPDSRAKISLAGSEIGMEPVPVEVVNKVDIRGEIGGENDSYHEEFKFILRPLSGLMEGRKQVAQLRAQREYKAFVEVSSDRTISLAKPEIALGRNQFMAKSSNVGVNALIFTRRYVTWVMSGKSEEGIVYFSTVEGTIAQAVTEVTQPVALGILGTYYVYVGDFEFTILLESTPRTELLFDRSN